jgi:preprotein translocase subunit SecF
MFKFYKNRKKFFAISCLLLLIGVLAIIFNGIKLDITFKGGSILKYSFTGQIDLAKAESAISKAIGIDVTCQETHALGSDERNLVINVAGDEALTPDQQIALQQALETTFPDTTFKYGNALMVNPFIGRELFTKGLWAILITSVLIVAYVWFSFRSMSGPSAGVMALVALFHDVVIAFFVFVICRIPINESLVAVVLSILGFSINDTIVIYDRIRENERLTAKKMPLADLVDLSINQSLSRSINTSLCTFGAVTVAYIFSVIYDIPSIQHFALPMMIGLISGAYSSIALAGPLWVMWKTRKGRSGYEGR